MNWQDSDLYMEAEEERKHTQLQKQNSQNSSLREERESKKALQLQKFNDPSKDPQRQAYIDLMNKFGQLLAQNFYEEITTDLMTPDCEIFIFDSSGGEPVRYSKPNQSLADLLKSLRVQERVVRESNVDVKKGTCFQICNVMVSDGVGGLTEKVTFDMFTVKEGKISKFRSSSGCLVEAHGPEDVFAKTRKDLILQRMKEINYALVEQDFRKLADMFHEDAQYKMWNWDEGKCHVFTKANLAARFRDTEENLKINGIVPYEVFTGSKQDMPFGVGTYVYYLENKKNPKEEYVWMSTCMYFFDKDFKVTKLSQQGELHPEDKISIPFEVYCRDRLVQRVHDFYNNIGPTYDLWYNDVMDFACDIMRVSTSDLPFTGRFRGMAHVDKLIPLKSGGKIQTSFMKPIEIYVDLQDPSYEVALTVGVGECILNFEGYKYQGQKINVFTMMKCSFENGKLVRLIGWMTEIPYDIPSPFVDSDFTCHHIHKRNDGMQTEN